MDLKITFRYKVSTVFSTILRVLFEENAFQMQRYWRMVRHGLTSSIHLLEGILLHQLLVIMTKSDARNCTVDRLMR